MQQRLNEIERQILTGAVNELKRLRATTVPSGYGHGALMAAVRDATEGTVRCDAARWCRDASYDASGRVAISRAYKRLEAMGLCTRIAGGYVGKSVTHLQLSEAGIALAAEWETALDKTRVL